VRRAKVAQWLLFANATLAVALFVPSNREREFPRLMGVLDGLLEGGRPLVGEQWGAADCAVQAYLAYLPIFFPQIDLEPWPGVQAAITRAQASPAYQRAMGSR
jgi:glutathione S-transferase